MRVTPAELIRPEIRALAAYPVADARGLIKLDAMENPYPWPGELVEDWLAVLRDVALNRYPDPRATVLRERLGATLGLPAGVELLLGNGSDELIQLLALTLAGSNGARRVLLAPEPGFVMYRMVATFTGMDYVGVPLTADFALDEAAMREAIDKHRPVLVFIAYPNNPTGNLFDAAAIRRLIAATPGLVVVDEAYSAFAEDSLIDRLTEYDNLLVMRTLSKLGLAGLRLGYLIGAKHWLHEIDKLRLPYNINTLTQRSVEFALRHRDTLEEQAARIRRARDELYAELARLPGVMPYPSQANFILFRVPQGQAGGIFEALRQDGVLIKNFDRGSGPLRDCLRVTVSTPAENRVFLDALRSRLETRPPASADPVV